MRRFTMIVILLFIATFGFSADKETEKPPQGSEKLKSSGQKIVKEKKTPTWPRPYTSTEEISVDSSVPFPNDI